MRHGLILAAALSALVAAPAVAQTPAPPTPPTTYTPPNFLDLRDSPYRGPDDVRDRALQCFEGRHVTGANRAGDRTLYLQDRSQAVFRLELAQACPALDAAETLTVRASRRGLVCAGDTAVLVASTATGEKRCRVDALRRVTSAEAKALAAAPRR